MIITVEGAGDAEVQPGTALHTILASVGVPAARWCGPRRLDPDHRAGVAPMVEGALLATRPGPAPWPVTGPHLRIVAGPDAGARLDARAGVVLGRAGTEPIADPALSRLHLEIDAAGRVRDLGSTNGTLLERRGRRRRLGRHRRRLRAGDLLIAGGTHARWMTPEGMDDATGQAWDPAGARPQAGSTPRHGALLAGIAGALAGAVALGAATGRWTLGLVMLAGPVAAGAAALRASRREDASGPVGLEVLPTLPLPLAIRGHPDTVAAVARALAVAHGGRLHGDGAEPWMRWLTGTLPPDAIRAVAPGAPSPSEAVTVIDPEAGTVTVGDAPSVWTSARVSARTAEALARAGASMRAQALPDQVRWGDLPAVPSGLAAAIGVDDRGPVVLDLDRDGPHVLVAGTTGAGKSALLETLVSGLAHRCAPASLGLGLVDLKGGAGLRTCVPLPHVRGVLTDLEPTSARRALLGLAAELRERKRSLAAAGFAAWKDWEAHAGADGPARLVVVVDEFQELGTLDSGFLPELARLAAQGRGLGVHLVLATQRPAGAVTPAIRANIGTVIALRTASAAESQDLLGDAAAADLPAARPGRAILVTPHRRTTFQAALAVADRSPAVRLRGTRPGAHRALPQAAADRWKGTRRAAPLWRPSLAADAPPAPGAIGWLDLPERRAQTPLVWDHASGAAVVVGPRGSGRTSMLAAVARVTPGAVLLPTDPREAARTLALCLEAPPTALLVDDAERASAALDPLTRGGATMLEDVARVMPVALACGPGWGARWASRAGLRVVLSGLDRVEQALWGVPPALVTLEAAQGRGVAITATEVGECRIAPPPAGGTAESDAHARLVAPLVCGDDLPPGALGVVGDDARPLRLPPGAATVVATPGRVADATLRALTAAGIPAAVTAHVPSAAGTLVVTAPTPARVRELGLALPYGLVDVAPPPGRVLVRREGRWEAAQLRIAP